MAYLTWKDVLLDVGLCYEGPRHRSRWIKDAAAHARGNGKSVPEHLEETVQQVFESNCEGSALYKGSPGRALFTFSEGRGAGYWGVNRTTAEADRAARPDVDKLLAELDGL